MNNSDKIQENMAILNKFRNRYYNAPAGSEELEIAKALNVILPVLREKVDAEKEAEVKRYEVTVTFVTSVYARNDQEAISCVKKDIKGATIEDLAADYDANEIPDN